jgi:hypothetical protein
LSGVSSAVVATSNASATDSPLEAPPSRSNPPAESDCALRFPSRRGPMTGIRPLARACGPSSSASCCRIVARATVGSGVAVQSR